MAAEVEATLSLDSSSGTLTYSLVNRCERPLRIRKVAAYQDLIISTAKGERPTQRLFGWMVPEEVVLKPGDSAGGELDPLSLYVFWTPGEYAVELRYESRRWTTPLRHQPPDMDDVSAVSNPVTIFVSPETVAEFDRLSEEARRRAKLEKELRRKAP